MLVLLICYVILSFLLGSILFCPIVCKRLKGVDIIKDSVDHNPGAFNAIELGGIKVGMLGLFLDLFKGALPTYIFCRVLSEYCSTFWLTLVIIAPVLGHGVGIFNKLKGGKCITTSFGVLIGIVPISNALFILASIYIISCCFVKVSDKIKSIATFTLFAIISIVLIFVTKNISVCLGCIGISLIAIIKHLIDKSKKVKNIKN